MALKFENLELKGKDKSAMFPISHFALYSVA